MSLPQDKITHLYKITALTTNAGEINIDNILKSFDTLRKLDISDRIISTRSGQGYLLLREDTIKSSISRDELLKTSKQKVISHQIALTSIMHGE